MKPSQISKKEPNGKGQLKTEVNKVDTFELELFPQMTRIISHYVWGSSI
jgi:hypothetical protein